jgi:hypothetical protein
MTANRRIAAGIDQRVRQLAGQNLSDSALVDQMVAYMADLQALWNSTTDEELDALCEEYPGFVRYATVMESLSEALRTGVGVPAHVKQMPRLPEHIKEPMQRLLTEGAALERRLQQRIDESRRGRKVGDDTSDVEVSLRDWSAAVSRLVREVQGSELAPVTQQPILRAFRDLAASIRQLQKTATSAQTLARHHTVQSFRPRMTINRRFMAEFMAADAPCFALGFMEEQKRVSGFLALRLDPPVPRHVTDIGLRLGQGLIGTSEFEVVHFTFEFYGHGIYHALVNPNNPLVRPVLACMVQTQDYVFFSINADSDGAASVFRSPLDVAGFAANFPRIERSTTTEEQYARTVKSFSQRPDPPGVLLHWVCRDNLDALDLDSDRLDMTPGR